MFHPWFIKHPCLGTGFSSSCNMLSSVQVRWRPRPQHSERPDWLVRTALPTSAQQQRAWFSSPQSRQLMKRVNISNWKDAVKFHRVPTSSVYKPASPHCCWWVLNIYWTHLDKVYPKKITNFFPFFLQIHEEASWKLINFADTLTLHFVQPEISRVFLKQRLRVLKSWPRFVIYIERNNWSLSRVACYIFCFFCPKLAFLSTSTKSGGFLCMHTFVTFHSSVMATGLLSIVHLGEGFCWGVAWS